MFCMIVVSLLFINGRNVFALKNLVFIVKIGQRLPSIIELSSWEYQSFQFFQL